MRPRPFAGFTYTLVVVRSGGDRRAVRGFMDRACEWLGCMAEPSDATQPARARGHVEASFRELLETRIAGRYAIGCSGQGRFRMSLAGQPAFDADLNVPVGTDPTEAYVRPPQRFAAISLEAGQSGGGGLGYLPCTGPGTGGDTSFVLGGVSFQLNIEEPYAADDDEIARAEKLAVGRSSRDLPLTAIVVVRSGAKLV